MSNIPRLNNEQLRNYRDLMIKNIESYSQFRYHIVNAQDLILIELITRELERQSAGGYNAPIIEENKND